MIKTIAVATEEIDDIEVAVSSLKAQIDKTELLKNTVGIVAFHREFELSGVIENTLRAFDFPIIGITTVLNGIKGNKNDNNDTEFFQNELLLSLMVMTSDDVYFDVSVTEEIPCELEEEHVCGATKNACEKVLSKPYMEFKNQDIKTLFVFTPNYMVGHGGHIVETLSEMLPGLPVFGAAAVDDSVSFKDDSFVVSNVGGYNKYYNSIGFIRIYGNVNPKFYSVSISEKKILGKQAVITSANDRSILSLNEKPVIEFLNSLGLADFLTQSGAISELSLMIKEDDTMPVYSRTMLCFDEEKGSMECGAFVKEGSLLNIGLFERADMLSVAEKAIKTAVKESASDGLSAGAGSGENSNAGVMFVFSCATRYVVFGADNYSELELLNKYSGNLPYLMAYAGGELCPVLRKTGENVNRFNNQSFSICTL
jgi:small ligand-binding sensory domain FIST